MTLGVKVMVNPRGGFYLWCALPDGLNAADVAHRALAQNVVLAPGPVFSPSQSLAGFMRFNVSQMGGDRGWTVLKEALKT